MPCKCRIHGLRELQYVVEKINDSGGVLDGKKFEIIALDSKTNPQEALIALKQLTDQGVKFFFKVIVQQLQVL